MKETFNYTEFASEVSEKYSKQFKQYEPIFELLYNWQEDWHLYNILTFHDTQFYKLEEESFIDCWGKDSRTYFEDKFVAFAYDGGGGHFCFWLYPDLVGEPPIVFIDGHGEQEFLASNLADFVNRMINELDFCGGWISKGDDVEETFKEMRWELVDNYQEHKNKEITEDEVEVLFKKDRALFKEKAGEIISYKTTEQIKKDFDKHPNFDEWIKKAGLSSFFD